MMVLGVTSSWSPLMTFPLFILNTFYLSLPTPGPTPTSPATSFQSGLLCQVGGSNAFAIYE